MTTITTIGLDLAKKMFQVHGVDAEGKVVVARRLRRKEVLPFFAKLPPCLVGMEACGSAHYWAREITKLKHTVKLMPPKYVKAYVKRGKTDAGDAAAICEAVARPSMTFVPVKGVEQQGLSMLHSGRKGAKLKASLPIFVTIEAWTDSTNSLSSPLSSTLAASLAPPDGCDVRLRL